MVVGANLADAMTTRELKAVVAHEIAHVIRRDVLRLLGMTLAGGTCYTFIFIHSPRQEATRHPSRSLHFFAGFEPHLVRKKHHYLQYFPYQAQYPNWQGFLIGAAYVGLVVPIVYIVLPGFVSRRAEYGADRLAARLLGGAMPMIEALRRLHELRDVPLDRKNLTHPTGAERIAALEALSDAQPTR